MQKLSVKSVYNLSTMQEGMLFHALLDPESPAYFEQFLCTIHGELDVHLLEQSFNILIEKYDVLRTNFMHENLKSPKQIVFKERSLNIHYIELSSNSEQESKQIIEHYIVQDKLQGFDLVKDMLIRLAVFKMGEGQYQVIWSYHHIIMDGWCLKILLQQWLELYVLLAEGRPISMGEVRPYSEYIQWLDQQDTQEAEQFWRHYLSDYSQQASLPTLPLGDTQSKNVEYLQIDHSFYIHEDVAHKLEIVAKKYQVTLNTVLQTVWGVLLGKYNRTEDVVFGVVTSGRPAEVEGIEEMIGLFINTIPVRVRWDVKETFAELLKNVQQVVIDSQNYDYYPLADIQSCSDLSRNLIHHLYGFQNNSDHEKSVLRGIESHFSIDEGKDFEQSNYDFNIIISASRGLEVNFKYNANVMHPQIIHNMENHYRHLLKQVSDNPEILICNMELITDDEKKEILDQFNDTCIPYELHETFIQHFETQVFKTPDQLAVVFRDQRWTYRELNEKANQLARWLMVKGVTKNQIVALMLEHSSEMIVGILGIAKAGAAFLPIDHQYPTERVKFMMLDSQASILLSRQRWLQGVSWETETADIDEISLDTYEITNIPNISSPSDLAYIIYTSGSTGQPKGVMLEHRSLLNQSLWHAEYYKITEEDRCSKYIGFGFDPSVIEIVPTLIVGSVIEIIPEELRLDVFELNRYLEERGVTVAILPTPMCEQLMRLDNHSLTRVITGGDKLKSFRETGFQLYNNYGPTENTIVTTSFKVDRLYNNIPIGKPVSNVRTYIVDKDDHLLPVGVAGELCIAGAGLARGYLNQPELTLQSFVLDPYYSGERMYRTGDLCSWLPDGNIEFIGRIDQQVKIRGYRIELGEIECRLIQQPEVKEAVVTVFDHINGEKMLFAYIVSDIPVTINHIRRNLAKELPEYMIPTYMMFLDQMPLTVNGKIDRKGLPVAMVPEEEEKEYTHPRNDIEARLIEIWKDVLGVNKVGVYSHFFNLGGNSLSAIRLVSAIKKELQSSILLKEIFQNPVLSDMAKQISGEDIDYSSIEPAAPADYYPVSSAQKRLLIVEQLEGVGDAYHIPVLLRIRGELDLHKWKDTIHQLIKRHDSLRTTFTWVQGEPMQQVNEQTDYAVDYVELLGGEADIEAAVAAFIRPFDLSRGPLFRARLARISEHEYVMMVDMHHIITDGTSIGVLVNEFSQLYREETLPELRIQYKDYAVWQREQDGNDQMDRQEQYWISQFQGEIPVLNLPLDHPRPQMQSFEGASLTIRLESELSELIRQLIADTGSTLYMVMLSAYTILLSKYSGQEDVVVGSPVAGRPHADLEQVVGMFVNTLALRSYPEGSKTFRAYVQEMKERVLEAFEHQEYPYEQLIEKLNVRRDFSRNPLFDTVFAVENMNIGDIEADGLTLEPYPLPGNIAKFDLTFTVAEEGKEIILDIEYASKLFDRATIERMATHYLQILAMVTEQIDIPLADVSLLSGTERRQIVEEFNDTWSDYPREKMIHTLFEEQAKKSPDKVAVTFELESMTYRDLNERSDRLAAVLRSKGTRKDRCVAIVGERSITMIVGMLAVLKAGGAYMPIDPHYPTERLSYLLQDSQAEIVLVQKAYAEQLLGCSAVVLELEDEDNYVVQNSDHSQITSDLDEIEQNASVKDLAYVMYTSGSTGQPKGVMIEHRNVVRLVKNSNCMRFEEGDRILQTGSPIFDAYTFEIWGALLNGLELYVVDKYTLLSPELLGQAIREYGITILFLTTPLFSQIAQERQDIFEPLRYLIVGGDTLSPKYIQSVRNRCSDLIVINGYGPTENTTFSTTYVIEGEWTDNIPVGKPVSNSTAYIVDQYGQLLPVGVPGELWVGGEGVGRGYLNNEMLTAEKFIVSPFVDGEMLYRTGDRAQWLPDGNVKFLGRLDFQVKIRGFRVETGEIENRIMEHDAVKETTVVVIEEMDGSKSLCAYVVVEDVSRGDMKTYIEEHLPEYMVPSYVMLMEKLPLMINGKVDRKSLPQPERLYTEEQRYLPPETETERELAVIWQDILDVKQVGRSDHFFHIGGHSLKAAILVSRISKQLQAELPLREVFRMPVLSDMAKQISKHGVRYSSLKKATPADYYPVSSAQKRLLIVEQLEGVGDAYHIPVLLRIRGELDLHKWKQTIHQLIKRHDSLRTTFTWVQGEPMQQVNEQTDYAVDYVELLGGEADIEAAVTAFIRPFVLSRGPLFRARLARISEHEYVMMVDMHHIITDGTSIGVLVNEFSQLFREVTLPELRIQYKDYAVWQREQDGNDQMDRQEQYWINQFQGEIPVLNLPLDHPRPQMQSFEGASLTIRLESELSELIRQLIADTGSTLYMVMLSAYTILLSKYSGQEDVVVGSPVAGRPHADLEQVVGMFVNTLALRSYPEGSKTFRAYVQEMKERVLEAFEHQEYPYEQLIEKLNVRRDFSRNPLFDTVFAVENMNIGNIEADGLTLEPYPISGNIAKFDLTFTVAEEGKEIILDIEYASKLFDRATIERLATHYLQILAMVTEQIDIPLADVSLLSWTERRQIVEEFNDTWSDYPREKMIHTLFEEQAKKSPDKVAVTFGLETMTYQELNERSDRLAAVLRSKGTRRDRCVAIVGERSITMIVGMLAVLKAGGAYMPIDPHYPTERLSYLLQDSQAEIVLVQKAYAEQLLGCSAVVLELEDEDNYVVQNSDHSQITSDLDEIEQNTSVKDLAYVMYTSGSTGQPKGVMIEHRNVVRLVKNTNYIRFEEGDRILQTGSPVFDACTFEIWGALLNGLELYVVDKYTLLNPTLLGEAIREYGITTLWLTSPLFNQIAQEHPNIFEPLKYLIVGGDALTPKHIQSVRKQCSELIVMNGYGPTENTTFSTIYVIDREWHDNIPIGKPISNSKAYIVDQNGQLLPVGVPGELWVGGEGVGRGYLNNEMLTTEKFRVSPFIDGEMLYRTGDRAQWLPDGNVKFMGRLDYQVKIRGFRVETGEIENRIMEHDAVKETTVVVIEETDGSKSLCAYVVADDVSGEELKAYVKEQLPEYMVPSYVVLMDKLPLTMNGKVDRNALPQPESGLNESDSIIHPRDEVEERIVEIWEELLHVKPISVFHNFFELGGHSLKAVQLVSRFSRLGWDLSILEIFTHPTPAGLAEWIKHSLYRANDEAAVSEERILFKEREDPKDHSGITLNEEGIRRILVDLNVIQEGFAAGISGGAVDEIYNTSPTQHYHLNVHDVSGTVVMLDRPTDKKLLEQALLHLISKQDVLRSVLIEQDGELYWKLVHNPLNVSIPHLDISVYTPEVQDIILQEIMRNFFLSNYTTPGTIMYRILLVTISESKHSVIMPFSHAIFDYMSSEVIRNKLIQYYECLQRNQELPADTGPSYRDFIQHITQGPKGLSDEMIMEEFALEQFKDASCKAAIVFENYDPSTVTSLSYEVKLKAEGVSLETDEMWMQSLRIFLSFFQTNFGLRCIPAWITHYGRQYGQSQYFNLVGECIDYLPILLDAENSIAMNIKTIKDRITLVSECSLNIANLMYNDSVKEEWSRSVEHVRDAFALLPINFNYLGEQDMTGDVLKGVDVNGVNNGNKNRILYTCWHHQGYVHVNVVLPFTDDPDRFTRSFSY